METGQVDFALALEPHNDIIHTDRYFFQAPFLSSGDLKPYISIENSKTIFYDQNDFFIHSIGEDWKIRCKVLGN